MGLRAQDLGVELPRLPVDRGYDPAYARSVDISPNIRRVLARNPNAFTFHGTGTYIVGRGQVAVIDPGPLIDEHVEALLQATRGETISHILITHTHSDHSPAAAPLKKATGARSYGIAPRAHAESSAATRVEESGDMRFAPDLTVKDGDVIEGPGWRFHAVCTPGHMSNHVCFAFENERALFCGDHVMGWSTTVIAPPDGDMAQYFASLEKLLKRDDETYYPTHGNPIRAPREFVKLLIEHRHARERQLLACLARGLSRISDMVPVVYSEVDPKLHPAASMSVLAHLQHMVATGQVRCEGEPGSLSHYHAA